MKERVRAHVHLEVQISRPAALERRLALSGEAYQLAIGHPGRNRDAHGVRRELDVAVCRHLGTLEFESARRAPEGLLELHFDPRVVVSPAAVAPALTEGRRAAKERGEEIT